MDMLVSARGITKTFHGSFLRNHPFTALSNVSIDIARGKVYGLVGESGSGKTTLARCLLYLEKPTEGEVVFDGEKLDAISRHELRLLRNRMQIIFQDPDNALNPRISAFRSLGEGITNRGYRGEELKVRIEEIAEIVSIPPGNLSRRPAQFSGGQRQRLVIARALLMDPEFLILDEPVSNLDVSIQAQIINLLMGLKDRFALTYLFISHDLNLVAYVSDVVGVMHAGRIVELGPADVVLKDPLHGYTRALLNSATRLSGSGITVQPISRPISTEARRSSPRPGRITGCAFAGACECRDESCIETEQVLVDTGSGHLVACARAVRR